MENPPKQNQFIKNKYNTLHTSLEVSKAAERTEKRIGESVSQKPQDRIENYLQRFQEILDRTDKEERAQGIEALRHILHKQLIIKEENIPYEYFLEQEQRVAEAQGHGRLEATDTWKEAKTKEILDGQKRSLDAWVDYLTSPDALYPMWAKYWAFRSMTTMGGYNKKEGRYTTRTETSSQPFPTLNIACLAKTIDLVQRKVGITSLPKDSPERLKKEKELDYALNHNSEYKEVLSGENFTKMYTYALEQFSNMSFKHLETISGTWKKYEKGSDPDELYESLQGYPLEWCTATNIETARTQLQGGDFHVYYSHDEEDRASIPRLAIRMTGDSISEIRGIEKDQNVDQFIQPIIDEKLTEFGQEGASYLKKSEDMKHMTHITEKHRAGMPLSKEELSFAYQVDNTIEGFGYQEDPRIKEVLESRNTREDIQTLYSFDLDNPKEDALKFIWQVISIPQAFQNEIQKLQEKRNLIEDLPTLFSCTPDQIATNKEDVTKDTKVYIGDWNIDVHNVLPENIEHVYRGNTLENKIYRKTLELSTKTPEEYTKEIKNKGYEISQYAQDILDKLEPLKESKEVHLVSFMLKDLGFPQGATIKELYDKAQTLGLSICDPHVGPEMRLSFDDQKKTTYYNIAMEGLTDRDGDLSLFRVHRYGGSKTWLDSNNASPDYRYRSDYTFVFSCSK